MCLCGDSKRIMMPLTNPRPQRICWIRIWDIIAYNWLIYLFMYLFIIIILLAERHSFKKCYENFDHMKLYWNWKINNLISILSLLFLFVRESYSLKIIHTLPQFSLDIYFHYLIYKIRRPLNMTSDCNSSQWWYWYFYLRSERFLL